MIEQLKNIVVLCAFLFLFFGVGVMVGLKLPENESYQRWNSANQAQVEKARPTDVAVMQMPGSERVNGESAHSGAHSDSCPGGVCKLPSANETSAPPADPPKKDLDFTFYKSLADQPTESGGSVIRIKTAREVEKKKPSSRVLKGKKRSPEIGADWEVRICSLAQEVKARLVRSELMKTYPGVKVEAVQVAGKGTWYRVKICNIKDRGEAERYQRELAQTHKFKPMIVKQ